MCSDSTNKHVIQFNKLMCASDVLSAALPKGHPRLEKEISEAVSVFNRIPRKGCVWDLCAGTALTSVLAAHMGLKAVAVDTYKRANRYGQVKNFQFREMDLQYLDGREPKAEDTVIALHPCGRLAKMVIDFYLHSSAANLILMPCCLGQATKNLRYRGLVDGYTAWCIELMERIPEDGFHVRAFRDKHNLSPRNVLIVAKRKKDTHDFVKLLNRGWRKMMLGCSDPKKPVYQP